MGFYSEFRYGDGVTYGSLNPIIKFWAEPLIDGGGSVHGGLEIAWDVTKVDDCKAAMVVARRLRPATVPEEGDTLVLDWKRGAGTHELYGYAGTWTYLSLFLLGGDNHWYLGAFALALPVSDWEYGTRFLPSLLPGVLLADDGGARSPTDENAAMTGMLKEIGFVFDEVKTHAESLVPYWDMNLAAPQAAPALASLMRLEYLPDLGPGVYQDLLGIPNYGDTTLDVLGEKVERIVRWTTRPRVSRNQMLDMNDSSAEGTVGRWIEMSTEVQPLRREYSESDPADDLLLHTDVSPYGYFRFHTGDWRCGAVGQRSDGSAVVTHALAIDSWPAIQAGFMARVAPTSAAQGTTSSRIALWLHTYANTADPTPYRVPVLAAELTEDWQWFRTPDGVTFNTDAWGLPVFDIPGDVEVDIDAIYIGPGLFSTETITPDVLVWAESDYTVRLRVDDAPDFGTAVIDWNDWAHPYPEEVAWSDLLADGVTHDYTDAEPSATRYLVTVTDRRDRNVAGVGTVLVNGDIR